MSSLDVKTAGRRFNIAMFEASASVARLNLTMLERRPVQMNEVQWEAAKERGRHHLREAETRLQAIREAS